MGKTKSKSAAKDLIEYINIIYDEMPQQEWSIIPPKGKDTNYRVKLRKYCPKLGGENGKMCTIYNDRPKICRDYNCVDAANHGGNTPQDWDEIKKLILEKGGKIIPLK